MFKHPNIVLGLATLVQKITNGELSAAVFSSNLEPRFITRQIMTLAFNKHPEIRLLIVPNLELLLEKIFGIKSYTCGITFEEPAKEEIVSLLEVIKAVSVRFRNPMRVKYLRNNQNNKAPIVEEVAKTKKPEPLLLSIDFDSLYLKRTDGNKKAWTPSTINNSKDKESDNEAVSDQKKKKWSDFISLDDDLKGADDGEEEMKVDLDEEQERLKSLLLGTSGIVSINENPMECEENTETDDDDGEDKKDNLKQEPIKTQSVFLKPEETSGNQWGSLLKPENVVRNLNKQQKRQEKRQRRKEKKNKEGGGDGEGLKFHPMKINKIQPNPMKVKKNKKIKKAKK